MYRYISEIVVFLLLRAHLALDRFITRRSYDPPIFSPWRVAGFGGFSLGLVLIRPFIEPLSSRQNATIRRPGLGDLSPLVSYTTARVSRRPFLCTDAFIIVLRSLIDMRLLAPAVGLDNSATAPMSPLILN